MQRNNKPSVNRMTFIIPATDFYQHRKEKNHFNLQDEFTRKSILWNLVR